MASTTLTTHAEQFPLPLESSPGLSQVFQRVFQRMGINSPVPDFQVEYHPFVGLRSTIRLRDGQVGVHISDVLEGGPALVLEALAEILLAQVFRRRASREARECYLAYVLRPAVRRRIDEARRRRGSKRLLPARGRWHNLDEIFARLNRRFFQGKLPPMRLGWSLKRSRTVLGHFDSAHRTIIISRTLDSPSVPRYLVEYLVYHEVLHGRFPVERDGHRRVVHPRQFRQAERKFPRYEQARQLLKHLQP